MAELAIAAGILWWMLCGALVTLVVMVIRGKWLFDKHELFAPYAERLGMLCYVLDKKTGEWEQCYVVAVSHKGAVAVRRYGCDTGSYWVPANKVDERVRFTYTRKR